MAKENNFVLVIWIQGKFYSSKILFKLVKRIEGFETKLQALESPDSDKRAKSYTKTKIRSGIANRKIADLIREKEKRRTLAKINKPEKPIYFKKTKSIKPMKTDQFFLKKKTQICFFVQSVFSGLVNQRAFARSFVLTNAFTVQFQKRIFVR